MIKLFIVEDDDITRESLVAIATHNKDLLLLGASINAEDGIEQIKKEDCNPDILLLDIGLPGMSGIEAIPHFKNIVPDLDIIMFTSFDEEEIIFDALCAGACSYIAKSASIKKIVQAFQTVHEGGSYMSPSIARKIANHFQPKKKTISMVEVLSNRQMDVVGKLVDGHSYKMIASDLNISIETVRTHIKKIYKKLEVNSSLEVVKRFKV